MKDYSDDNGDFDDLDVGHDPDICDQCGTDEGVTEMDDGPNLCNDCFNDWIS